MGACDLCGKDSYGAMVKAGTMSDAVRRGFNPFQEGLISDMSKLLGMGSMYDEWKPAAINGRLSKSDWNICSACMPKLQPFLEGPKKEPPEAAKLKAFWVIIRKGPSHSDDTWYLSQIKDHFGTKLATPEKLFFIADSGADIGNEYFRAAILVKYAEKLNVNATDGVVISNEYTDGDGYKGVIICWKNKASVKPEFNCTAPQLEAGSETVTDIDGNVYHTIKIGNQIWTVENLKVTKYNDGTPILRKLFGIFSITKMDHSKWATLKTAAYCYYANNFKNKKKYGLLYNWYAVNTGKLAPNGWHVPTDVEYNELENYLIANGYNLDGSKEGDKIAKSMAAKTDWEINTDSGTIGNDLSKNNRSGFSALPGGYRSDSGDFKYQWNSCNWWSATEDDASKAWYRSLIYVGSILYRNGSNKSCGFSVRLLRD